MNKVNLRSKARLRNGWLFFLISLGVVLRLYKWTSYSFWYDECQWLSFWKGNLWLSLINSIYINKPPLFKLLLYGWSYFAKDEFSLRLLPLFFSLASIILTYQVGKILCDKKTALVCCILMIFSPFHIYYSQELTHYSLTLFFSLCSVYYFMLVLKQSNKHVWVKLFLFTSLALYTNYVFIFLLITENIYFFAIARKDKNLVKSWLLCQLLLLAVYLPLILATINAYLNFTVNFHNRSWVPQGSLLYILQTLRVFNVGYNATATVNVMAALLSFPLLFIGMFFNLKERKQNTTMLIFWLFIPMLLSILSSKLYHTFIYRNFIFALPAYYLLIAKGLLNFKRFIYIPVAIFLILSGLSLINYYRNIFPYPEKFYRTGVHPKKDNRTAVAYINKNFHNGDTVVHLSLCTTTPYFYYSSLKEGTGQREKYFSRDIKYLEPTDGRYFFPDSAEGLADSIKNVAQGNFVALAGDSAIYKISELLLIENDDAEILKLFINPGVKRIWLVISAWEQQDFSSLLERSNIKRWLEDRFEMLDNKRFNEIEVRLYKIS